MLNYGVFIVFGTEVQVYLPASEADRAHLHAARYGLRCWHGRCLGERPSLAAIRRLVLAIGGVALLVGAGVAGRAT